MGIMNNFIHFCLYGFLGETGFTEPLFYWIYIGISPIYLYEPIIYYNAVQ
jgi:hypothetical protein